MPRLNLRFWENGGQGSRGRKHVTEPEANEERHGLFVIEDKPAHETSAIDIVAVHGLNGHYEKTWSAHDESGQDINWLRDFLPKSVDNARVMSFGFKPVPQFDRLAAAFNNFAEQLLDLLLSKRTTKEEQSRPILFICHSLGGAIVKQALDRAHRREPYRPLLDQVLGVAFFGSPHQESDGASWSTILNNLLRTVNLGTNTNSTSVRNIEENSLDLDRISKSFIEQGKRLEICSFYEVHNMDGLGCRVVDKSSAVLGWSNETAIAIQGDHRSICRFSRIDEQNYFLVGRNLQMMARKTNGTANFPQTIISEDDSKCRDDFFTTDYESHHSRNPLPVSGTCRWILNHKIYRHWQSTQSPAFLWISADPGCGKSVLMSFLISYSLQNTATSSLQRNVCYFFFKTDNDEQRWPVNAMSAILHQIYTAQPGLIKHARQQLAIPGQNVKSLDTLWKIFSSTVEDSESNDTICFIDAFDECDELPGRQFIRLISHYFSSRAEKICRPPYLKMVIASRPENFMKAAFSRHSSIIQPQLEHGVQTDLHDTIDGGHIVGEHGLEEVDGKAIPDLKGMLQETVVPIIRLRGEDETDHISHDIELVVKAEIKDLTQAGLPLEILSNLQTELINRADRTFLWTTLIITLLKERSEAGASLRELNEILLSRDIYSIYSELLKARSSPTQARKALGIVLAAARPLTLKELNVALAVKSDHSTFNDDSNWRRPGTGTFDDLALDLVYPFENYIKSLCGHFLRIIRGKVYLVHETAREYLLSDDDEDNRGDTPLGTTMQHTFSLKSSHALLLEICVTYLYFLGKKSKYPQISVQQHPVGKLLRYAATYWTVHYRAIEFDLTSKMRPYYHNLCHPEFPGFQTWLQARSRQHDDYEPYGLHQDELQDYYLVKFKLIPEPERNRRTKDTRVVPMFSSNPGMLANHYFPLEVDETGFVSLKKMK
ncbi:hypothetical protein DL98DRAFT_595807 [Cadophora sp. DSE1049]|nr:hypothetical protein DL98DRAFT_595807 [Cadophora sp. DSE1049]